MPPAPDRLARKTESLLARFHRQRPVRAGSLLVSVLGDAIAPRGGQISLASLIRIGELFELPERLVRTSINRLAKDLWVVSTRSGRNSYYSFTRNGRSRFAEATQRIYAAQPPSWNGLWTAVIMPTGFGEDRDTVRDGLTWLGFGQVAPGVFVHPLIEEERVRSHVGKRGSEGLVIMRDAHGGRLADASLVRLGWDFGDLNRRYRQFIDTFSVLEEDLSESRDLLPQRAFLLRTLLLHEYRKIHLRDPLLPAVLLPGRWAGTEALELCRRIYSRVFRPSEQYLSDNIESLLGPLPEAADDMYTRFGGLPR